MCYVSHRLSQRCMQYRVSVLDSLIVEGQYLGQEWYELFLEGFSCHSYQLYQFSSLKALHSVIELSEMVDEDIHPLLVDDVLLHQECGLLEACLDGRLLSKLGKRVQKALTELIDSVHGWKLKLGRH